MLNDFYYKYVILKCSLSTDNPKIDSLKVKYCTNNLLQNIAQHKSKYDPFLQTYDFDSTLLNTLKIKNEGISKRSYLISFKLKNDEETVVRLIVIKDKGIYQIDSVNNYMVKNLDHHSSDSIKLTKKSLSLINLGKYVDCSGCSINIFINDSNKYIIKVDDEYFDSGIYEISPSENKRMYYINFKNIGGIYCSDTIAIENYGNAMNQYIYFKKCDEKYIYLVRRK